METYVFLVRNDGISSRVINVIAKNKEEAEEHVKSHYSTTTFLRKK